MNRALAAVGQRVAPPHFLLFLALVPLGALLWRHGGHRLTDSLVTGFDGAALAFLISLMPTLSTCDGATMRRRSAVNDANRTLVLAITSTLTLVVMAAIVGELPAAGKGDHFALAKLIVTLVLTWLFANTVYALHYAHLYYLPAEPGAPDVPGDGAVQGGLTFPGPEEPDYLDFVYFAFTLGMTFQTADVDIAGRAIRRIAIVHCFAAFIFNIGVIAFTINAIGSAAGA